MEAFNQILSNQPVNILLAVWTLFWKGWALWRAARNKQKIWFVCLLVINLLGILEIVYLLFFQKEGKLWNKVITTKKVKAKK